MIPHTNNWGYLLLAITLVAGVLIGWGIGHYRAYADCCDCCTCQTCTEEDRSEPEWADDGIVLSVRPQPDYLPRDMITIRRPAVVLEPGPTIYPALAELAGEVMDEPQRHADDMDSTFVSRVLLSWESRYPIPQEVR